MQKSIDPRRWPLLKGAVRWIRWRLPTRISSHRILTGPLRGRRIVTSWRDYPAAIAGITEARLLEWFSRNAQAGETWLDVGAHYGYTMLALAGRVGATGRVFAFEPMISTAGCLSRTRAVNGLASVTVIPLALGAAEGVNLVRLSCIRGMIDSTIGPRENGTGKDAWSEPILVSKFDWVWPNMAGSNQRVDGVKIDVQGMEIDVLRGMTETLRLHKPKLVVELHSGVDRHVFLDVLAGAGYSGDAEPIEPVPGEKAALLLDDRSYAFAPAGGR
jgi:FkbM family methyltransferase